MKGKNPSADQKRFHNLLCSHVGCLPCFIDTGMRNSYVAIHHVDGRTKPEAHWKVLALCAGHHQDGTGAPGLIAVHPWKRRFEDKYGTQMELLSDCIQQLIDAGHTLPDDVLAYI